jgi:ABC-type multidrug transport system fused ATPase/permease subunit
MSETRILNAVRRRGVTCVLITHRLSTVRDCDEIIVLEHGKIIERGTHAVMSEVGGPYSRSIEANTET